MSERRFLVTVTVPVTLDAPEEGPLAATLAQHFLDHLAYVLGNYPPAVAECLTFTENSDEEPLPSPQRTPEPPGAPGAPEPGRSL